MEFVKVAERPPLQWDDDAYAADGGPCRALATSPLAARHLDAGEPFDRGDAVQAWCEIRAHLRDWLARPTGVDRALSTPMRDLGDEVPGYRDRDDEVGDVLIPRTLAHLLARSGVDPRAFGTVAAWRPGAWTVHLGDLRLDVRVGSEADGEVRVDAIAHPDGVGLWDLGDGQIALYDTLPPSVACASVGRRVADLVSHPVIDGLDLTISDVTEWAGSVIHYRDGRVALRDIRIED